MIELGLWIKRLSPKLKINPFLVPLQSNFKAFFMLNISFRAIAFFIFLVLISWGCSESAEKAETTRDVFQSYRDKGVGTYFSVPPGLASVFLDEDQAGNAELKDLLSDIKQLSFLIIPNSSEIKENIYYSELDTRLNAINFVDFAMINSGSEIVKVKISHNSNDQIDEMIILVSNYETLFCISFSGEIDHNKIANLTRPENMVAVTNLNRFK